MGAAAFVMAEFLGMSYTQIMISAIFPAFLYYLACWSMIHLEAVKEGLAGLPKDQLPKAGEVLRQSGHLTIPVIAIVALLLYGLTPLYAAFFTILITVAVSYMKKSTAIGIRGILRALEGGARSAIGVAMACAVVGFVVGVCSLTSLGLTFGANILDLSGNNMVLMLVLTAVTALILGMGLPTTACYIVAATIAAPALIKIGVPPLVAHFFVFYFACLSNLTPPVCLAAFTAAGIAGASPYKVGWPPPAWAWPASWCPSWPSTRPCFSYRAPTAQYRLSKPSSPQPWASSPSAPPWRTGCCAGARSSSARSSLSAPWVSSSPASGPICSALAAFLQSTSGRNALCPPLPRSAPPPTEH
jgi:TRAP transporter 4TM/12TM fusion protein